MNSKIISKENSYTVMGAWGTWDLKTNTSKICGTMYSRDILIEHSDGSLESDTEWIADTNKNLLIDKI